MGSASTKFRKYLQNGDEYAAMQVFQSSPELQKSLNPNLSYGDSFEHNTPLHFAAKHAMKHLLRTFLNDLGGNPNKKNNRNETCLHAACRMSQTKSLSAHDRRYACVVFILQWRGATLANGTVEKIDITSCDEKSNTALHYAAASGLLSCVEVLVIHGAPLFVENVDKETPCDCAEKAGHESIALLLESKMVFNDSTDNINENDCAHTVHEVYSGLRPQDLQEAKDQLLVETSDMLHVPLFTAEALLRDNEWSRETLLDNWMKNPIYCCERAGVHPPTSALQFSTTGEHVVTTEAVTTEYQKESLNSPVRLSMVEDEMCEICTNCIPVEDDTVSMVCEHHFCRSCWESYLNVKIQEGDAHNILCPAYGCIRLVPVDVIESLVAPEMVRRYFQFDIKAFVDSNKNLKWCPYPECGRAVRLPESELANLQPLMIPNIKCPLPASHAVDCGNGHFFCWECLEEAHAPCGCEKWTEWHKKITEVKPEELKSTCMETEDAANCLWLVTNSKPCPNCKSPIQKNEGCNHMKCSKCKFDFCWICLEAWKKHNSATGGYFRCNRFDAVHRAEERHGLLISAAEVRNKELKELSRFVYYYTKFKKHENNHLIEEPLLKTCRRKMALLANSAQHSLPGTNGEEQLSFIEDAIVELLKARRVLCGSYVYGYYLEDNGYNRTIFEFMQNELEELAAKLALMVARPHLHAPRSQIIQASNAVKRKRLEFTSAVCKGLIPPETPPAMRRNRRRRFPGLMGIDPVEDQEQLSQAIAASLRDLDPNSPWVKDSQGRHTDLSAIYDWPDYDSEEEEEEEVEINNAMAASILGICSRKNCTKPRARNPRTGSLHSYCSLRCSKLDKMGESEESSLPYTSDYQMDLLIALEMSRLQMIEDMDRLSAKYSVNQVKLDDASSVTQLLTESDIEVVCQDEERSGASIVIGDKLSEPSNTCGRSAPLDTLDDCGDEDVIVLNDQCDGDIQLNIQISVTPSTPEKINNEIESNRRQNVDAGHAVSSIDSPSSATDGCSPEDSGGLSATGSDVAVDFFLKNSNDKNDYTRNINVFHSYNSKAEKDLIAFCKKFTKSAENINDKSEDKISSRRTSPRCSCTLHDGDSQDFPSQVLWEMQGNSSSVTTLECASGTVPAVECEANVPYGKLKKSPTDGSLCGDLANARTGRIGAMSLDMSVSLDMLTKKSSSAFKRFARCETRKQQHKRFNSQPTRRGRWFDWEFF